MVTGASGASAARAIGPLLKMLGPVYKAYKQRRGAIKPAELDLVAEGLVRQIRQRERELLDQLRGGPDLALDRDFATTAHFLSGASEEMEVLSKVGPCYRQASPLGRLVIVGEAGSGKTVLAISLLMDQLEHRDTLTEHARIQAPIWVRLNAAGWDGSGDFSRWLARCLAADYGQPVRVTAALVAAGRVVPVLDGLDEMGADDVATDRATKALAQLNEPPWRGRPVVVVCRTDVYSAIQAERPDAGLNGALAIALPPLSIVDIRLHLFECREQLGLAAERWAPVTDQLHSEPDGPLGQAFSTPWLLGLGVDAMRDDAMPPRLAACESPAAVRDCLLEAQIPAALHATPTAERHTEAQVHTWLRTLAARFDQQLRDDAGGNDIRLDRVWTMAGETRCRVLYGLAAGIMIAAVALVVALSMVLSLAATVSWFQPQITPAWVQVAQMGIVVSWSVLLVALWSPEAERFAWRVPGVTRWRRGVVPGALAGLAFGLYGVATSHPHRIVVGLVFAAMVAVPVGTLCAFRTTSRDRLVLGQRPDRLLADERSFAVIAGLFVGLAVIAVGLGGGWYVYGGLPFSIKMPLSLLIAVPVGAVAGLLTTFVLGRACGHHALACMIFRMNGSFSPRPRQFLVWARDVGLLRVTGLAYQFRHEDYRAWLTEHARALQASDT